MKPALLSLSLLCLRGHAIRRTREAQPWQEHDAHRCAFASLGWSCYDPRIGSTNIAAFEMSIVQVLVPTLQPGQIVIMDNLRAHKSVQVKQAIESKGCQRLILPSYSPDLSPIEEAFSKLKTILRRAGAITREALEEALAQALRTITAKARPRMVSV